MKKSETQPFHVRLPNKMKKDLDKLAAKEGLSTSQYIRFVLSIALEKKAKFHMMSGL